MFLHFVGFIKSHYSEETVPIGINTAFVGYIYIPQDELDGLMRENKELKGKNQNLESRLKYLKPVRIESAQTQDQTVDPQVLEEWTTKLQLATECCDKVQQDMDKLKEVLYKFVLFKIGVNK